MMKALQHSSAVGTGFIPVLPTADKIQSKFFKNLRIIEYPCIIMN